ncbi:DnaB-like helicase C terminal domain-containing protein [Treponema bryantii]|uniref:DnaB-like helicase C terminal domain-containing protein n=1 Tax=Treponema bryantii TaxID=163 RepID=A0A1I3LM38_9SPIR|nr:DnaB-like helicase C-terminal domain-containing protein [Treponema bryantii]SFI85767.1 DnaB-like helicase C terminal domain-containing protein [Treponema bryantii]
MEKTEDKESNVNLYKEIDYPYSSAKEVMLEVVEYIERRFKGPENEVLLETRFPYLSFQKEDLVVLASKPGIGKTNFVLSLISQLILDKQIPVALISPLISECEIGMRLVSINSDIHLAKIRCGMLGKEEVEKMQKIAGRLFEAPFYIYNEPNCSFKNIKKKAIEFAMEKHIQLFIVDNFEYLQELVDARENEYRTILTNLLREFRYLANELHIPIIITMNIPNLKSDLEPNLLDFKKYMVITEEADKVVFLHRERNKTGFVKQDAKLIVAKNTSGPTGDISVRFYSSTGKFTCTDF